MRDKLIVDSINDYKSVVLLCIYKGGGLDPLQTNSRANSVNLVNKHIKKLGTLIGFARADRPAPGPDRPTAHFGAQHMPPCFLVELSKPKATNSTSVFLSILPHTRMTLLEETPIQSFGQIFAL
jgi:hypothetical protein